MMLGNKMETQKMRRKKRNMRRKTFVIQDEKGKLIQVHQKLCQEYHFSPVLRVSALRMMETAQGIFEFKY